MSELLLELFSEEIPARMQARAADDLKRLVTDGLKKAELTFTDARAYTTPRRLALVVDGLPEAQPDVKEERRGPKVGAPDKAIEGFLNSVGMTLDQVEQREMPKGTFYFAVVERQGRQTNVVLADLLPEALAALPWPKSMRWGAGSLRWVRPLHSVLCLFGGETVPFTFGGIESSNTTCGHRFMAPEPITVTGFADYTDKLAAAKVMLDPADRRDVILADATKLAEADGLTLKDDKGLLDEVAGLVEWPVALMGRFDDHFMDVPPEVLVTAMRSHQKYFSCLDAAGRLMPRFITVANMVAADGGKSIVAGNEKVLSARLHDAKFFWDQDRKRTLASRAPDLGAMVFHAKLGTLDQKVDRIQALAVDIAGHIDGADRDLVRSAARLAKADLVSEMVGEFPELQGLMGRYYALHDGENPAVADAIAEHYSPAGPNDACPTAPVSVAVALADKIDTLAGFFAIDEKPTGSKDPFALRRAALGVIRLVMENGLRLPLRAAFGSALSTYGELQLADDDKARIVDEILDFFADRLKVHLREQGVRHDLIAAVFALGDEDDLVRLLARVDALQAFLGSDDGASLLVAFRRAANILRIEEKKDKTSYAGDVVAERLSQDEEKDLHRGLIESADKALGHVGNEDFGAAMAAMATLRAPVDAFFDHVTVNCDDAGLRENRLKLLSGIPAALGRVADFSKIEG